MKMKEKTKDYLRLALSSLFLLAVISLLMACGEAEAGGAAPGGSPDYGNIISGRVELSNASTASATSVEASANSNVAYTTATVQLVGADGAMLYETTTDEEGEFEFDHVPGGDYTMLVIDIKTGETMTQVNVSLLEGDDVSLEGVIDTTKTKWIIQFTSNNDESELHGEDQAQYVKKLAQASGVSIDEVIDMRLSGMSWVEIAVELGVDPDVLGLDNDKAFETEQTTTDTADDSVGSKSDDGEVKGKPYYNGEHDNEISDGKDSESDGESDDNGSHNNAGGNGEEDD